MPVNYAPGPFHCHPEQSEGSKVLAFLGVLLTKHFRFLAPLKMTDMGRKKIWA